MKSHEFLERCQRAGLSTEDAMKAMAIFEESLGETPEDRRRRLDKERKARARSAQKAAGCDTNSLVVVPFPSAENRGLYAEISGHDDADKSGNYAENARTFADKKEIPTRVELDLLPSEVVITPSQNTSCSSPKRPGKPSRKASKRCPSDWQPNDAHRAIVAETGMPSAAARTALEMFRDHEFRTARSDWDAAFRNWLRTEAKRYGKSGSDAPAGRVQQKLDGMFEGLMGAVDERKRRAGGGLFD